MRVPSSQQQTSKSYNHHKSAEIQKSNASLALYLINNITMADNEDDQDLVDYDEEEEEQNVAAEESADAEGKETKK